MELGQPLPVRKRLIAQLLVSKSDVKFGLRFQNKLGQYDVYTVGVGFPKYRLQNGRTEALQEQLLALRQDLPRDLFVADQEADVAQLEQHKLLKTLLNDANLLDYFKKNKQEEPLILTSTGIVVNGNRRLCAMRELLETDPKKFDHFRNIQVVFLPPATEEDLDELEAQLQIRPDIKAEYTWVARACMMRRRQRDHHYNTGALSRLYGLKPQDVTEELELLALADEYLDSIGKPKHYDAVNEDEFAFISLRKELRRVVDSKETALVKALAFELIATKPVGTGRLHVFITDVSKNRKSIAQRLEKELGEAPVVAQKPSVPSSKSSQEDLALLGGPAPVYLPSPRLRDTKVTDAINAILVDVVEGEKARTRQQERENSVVTSIISAHSAVRAAILALSSSTYKAEVQLQVKQLDEALGEFKQKLKKYDQG